MTTTTSRAILLCCAILHQFDAVEAFVPGFCQERYPATTSAMNYMSRSTNDDIDSVQTADNTANVALSAATTAATIALALSLPLFATPTIALADSGLAPDIERGSVLFTGNCAGCHAGGMNFVKEKKTLQKDALVKYVSADLDQPAVMHWVMNSGQHSRNVYFKAPSGNGKLMEQDWADVTTFVVDQALNDKW